MSPHPPFESSPSFARAEDRRDPLRDYRNRFHHPIGPDGRSIIYLAGNSLGLQPIEAEEYVDEVIRAWQDLAVEAHFRGEHPWLHYMDDLVGKMASIVGALAVIIFMVVAYGFLGIVATLALIANISMIIAILSVLGATITLPGIAGIVLTMGMAVDSNVLIYERIREEGKAGRSPILAIDAGFSRAFSTILDANITTLIAAVILFQLGSGPVRGFAVTLAIGILTTVFTAFLFTRLLVALWVRRRRPTTIPV